MRTPQILTIKTMRTDHLEGNIKTDIIKTVCETVNALNWFSSWQWWILEFHNFLVKWPTINCLGRLY